MRAHEFTRNLFEDYNTAKQKYIKLGADPAQVQLYVDKMHKELKTKNLVTGDEKNIDVLVNRFDTFDKFKEFITKKSEQKTKTDVKKGRIEGEFDVLHDDNEWLIVVPLDKDASCAHGRNTDWCTTKIDQRYFENYFYDRNVTLIYFINKNNKIPRKQDAKDSGLVNEKWAIAVYADLREMELFDLYDKSVDEDEFKQKTGFDPKKFRSLVLRGKTARKATNKRLQYKQLVEKSWELLSDLDYGQRSVELEKILIVTKEQETINKYVRTVEVSDYLPELQIHMVSIDRDFIDYISNPTRKVVEYLVKEDKFNWYQLYEKDNIPDSYVPKEYADTHRFLGTYLNGGLYVGLYEGYHYIVSESQHTADLPYGLFRVNSGAKSVSDGVSNTKKLVTAGENADSDNQPLAAQHCHNLTVDGYSDWYLPSIDELKFLRKMKDYFGTPKGYCWSSTESKYNSNTAYALRVSFPVPNDAGKYETYAVLPIRKYSGKIKNESA